jgi:hypothetical protein
MSSQLLFILDGASYGMTYGRLLRLGIFEALYCRGLRHGHAGLVDKYDEWHLQPRRWVRRKEGWSAAVQSSPVQSSLAARLAMRFVILVYQHVVYAHDAGVALQ